MAISTFSDLIRESLREHSERVFLPRRSSAGGESITFAQLEDESAEVAAGLLAFGLRRGDRVGLIAENRYEWLLADLACARIGLADVPRGTDTTPLELVFILRHAECKFVWVENTAAARILCELREELPSLERIAILDGEVPRGDEVSEDVTTLDQIRARGRELRAREAHALPRAEAAVQPGDLLTIVYTSGTTAEPKGVMLTHANVISNIETVREVLHFDAHDTFLSVLPAWHAYERILDYVAFRAGASITYTDRRRIKQDLAEVRPTVFAAVPRIWESVHDGIVNACRKQKQPTRWLLDRILRACRRVGAGHPTVTDRALHRFANRKILPRFRAAAGGRMRIAVSGGGALPIHVDQRLLGIGIPVLNGYGLTETSPVAAVRRPEDNRAGTIGPPLPRTEIEIRSNAGTPLPRGESGLIWIRGPQVMRGYYRNQKGTEEVLRDGWFNSGDLGHIEADGHIRITGRAKDTIVLAGGENVEPEPVEAALKTSPFIDQAVVLGQDRKSLGAILIPDLEALEQELPRTTWGKVDGVFTSDEIKRFFRKQIDELLSVSNGFRPLERVTAFRVLADPLSIENGLLTQTLKVKRHKVHEHHAPLIDKMFV